jgi:hypothetical protein
LILVLTAPETDRREAAQQPDFALLRMFALTLLTPLGTQLGLGRTR